MSSLESITLVQIKEGSGLSLLALVKPNGPSGFGFGTTADQVTEGLDLSGKTYLVTGVNSGLGRETLLCLTRRGAHVIGTARTLKKAERACAEVEKATPVECELTEPSSVRACAQAIRSQGVTIDAIICNAGIMNLPEPQTKHGLELQFLTNHLGHFILVTEVLSLLSKTGRVVVVSSLYHDDKAPPEGIQFDNLSAESGYNGWTAYGQSKLANVLFVRELSKRLPNGQTANALHPGIINTNLSRYMNPVIKIPLAIGSFLLLKNARQGAATQCFVATHPSLDGVTGRYFADCNEAEPSSLAKNDELAAKLWRVSEELSAKIH